MRSMVAQVLAPPGAHRGPLLPHNSSGATSSSHTRRHSLATPVAASAREGGGSGSGRYANSSSSSSRGGRSDSNTQDNDSRAKTTRSRHYYESTPKYKSRRADSDAVVSDAVADALSASFGAIPATTTTSTTTTSSSRRTGRNSGGRGRSRGGVSTADGYRDDLDDEEEQEDGRGWWEVPLEQRWGSQRTSFAAADPADLQLEPWQEQQLLLAAANSKKKMQVQTVAANVGLDRTEVLAWVAAFRAKPKSEQTKLLAPLQQQIQRMKAQQQAHADAAQEAEAVRRGRSPTQQQQQQQQQWDDDDNNRSIFQQPQQQQQQQQQSGALPFSGKNPDTGFVPFNERRGSSSSSGSSSSRSKRLPGEVLRTLEGVYARSPWPNKEIVAGLFDLHRLPRDLVLDWFTARRQMDGLPDNPRAAKQLAATARRALSAADAPQPLLPADMLPTPKQQPKPQQVAQPAEESAPVSSTPAQQQQQARVQAMTARELAALRSGLPSPRKQKGEKLKQELGFKAGPEGSKQLEIAGVTFVAKDGRADWRKVWRKRRSTAGLPAQQLDFNLWLLRQEQEQAAAAAEAAAAEAGTDTDEQGL